MAIKISHSHFVRVAFVSILVFQTFGRMIFSTLTYPGTRWYVMTVRDTQMIRNQKKFENHWSTRTQSSEQKYSYLMARKRHPSTPYSRNTPQSFSRGTRPSTLPKSTKHVYKSLACSQDLFCSATVAMKTALDVTKLCFNHFRGILAYTLPRRLRITMLVASFIPVILFVYGDDQFANFWCPSKTPCHLTHSSQAIHPAF